MQCISQHLIERYCLIQQAKTRRKVPREDVDLKQLYQSLSQDSSFLKHDCGILYATPHSTNNNIVSDVIHLTCINPDVRKLAAWCNKNILATICNNTRQTHQVLIRIATGMLNNLHLDTEIANYIHDNIVRNTYDAELDYIDQDLPF